MQNMQHPIETLWKKKTQFSKGFRTDGAHISKIYNYLCKKYA